MDDLNNLKVGDKVHSSSGYYDKGRILTITKITKTMIICDKQRFRIDGGYEVGSSGWIRTHIQILTEKLRDEVIHHNLHTRISNFKFNELNLKELRKIMDIVNTNNLNNPSRSENA